MKHNLRNSLKRVTSLACAKKYAEAWQLLESLRSENAKDEALIWQERGFVYSHANNNDAAISALSKSIELFNKEPNPYYTRGIIFLQSADYESAISDFTRVIELCDFYNSDYYRQSAYFLRADCFVRLKQYDKAKSDCSHVCDGHRSWTDRLRTKEEILAECK